MPDSDDQDELKQRRLARSSHPATGLAPHSRRNRSESFPKQSPLQNAAGFSGDWQQFICGQLVSCRVKAPCRFGYDVEIEGTDLPAVLLSIEKLETGAIVTAAFVSMKDGKALVAPNLSNDEVLEFARQCAATVHDGEEDT